ncbi:MAG: Oxidoreductase [Thelocarpon superellum]|nr:MAG: Oxidoreductase [Thelocarpon superellum]
MTPAAVAQAKQPLVQESSPDPPSLEVLVAEKQRIAEEAASVAHQASSEAVDDTARSPQTPQEYEDEASSQGAFNEETGEINWDCPCLGGMAHGPCGEEFRAAFSCFVYSKEEPKGMDCIDRFKGMQDCFRQHPDVYGAELDEDDEDQGEGQGKGPEGPATSAEATPTASSVHEPSAPSPTASSAATNSTTTSGDKVTRVGSNETPAIKDHVSATRDHDKAASAQVENVTVQSEIEEPVPKVPHDTRFKEG